MNIRTANLNDIKMLHLNDGHISSIELENIVKLNRVYVMEENGKLVGWLRYNLFWDNTPFMNMLYILEEYREKGYGRQAVEYWEEQMKSFGYKTVMTSTASNEYAQHFYNKLGYSAVGGFLLDGEPYEVVLSRQLT